MRFQVGQKIIILAFIMWAVFDIRTTYHFGAWAKNNVANLLGADRETKRARTEIMPDFYPLLKTAKKHIPESTHFRFFGPPNSFGYFPSAAAWHLFPRKNDQEAWYFLVYQAGDFVFNKVTGQYKYKDEEGYGEILAELSPQVFILKKKKKS